MALSASAEDERNAVLLARSVAEDTSQARASGGIEPLADVLLRSGFPAHGDQGLVLRCALFGLPSGQLVNLQIVAAEHPGCLEIVGDLLSGNLPGQSPVSCELVDQIVTEPLLRKRSGRRKTEDEDSAQKRPHGRRPLGICHRRAAWEAVAVRGAVYHLTPKSEKAERLGQEPVLRLTMACRDGIRTCGWKLQATAI